MVDYIAMDDKRKYVMEVDLLNYVSDNETMKKTGSMSFLFKDNTSIDITIEQRLLVTDTYFLKAQIKRGEETTHIHYNSSGKGYSSIRIGNMSVEEFSWYLDIIKNNPTFFNERTIMDKILRRESPSEYFLPKIENLVDVINYTTQKSQNSLRRN